MSGYEVITNRLIKWAEHNENIRAVILIGSRARSYKPADEWSDLDVVIIAEDLSVYLQTTSWLREMGTPMLTFTERAFDGSVERRVLYEGFLDVDFAFSDPSGFRASLNVEEVRTIFQRGCHVLLDKDDWSSLIHRAISVSPGYEISDDTIINEIHDYWYHCVWLTKKIQRGELWIAMHCLNCYMKAKLLYMIELYTRLSRDGEVDTWHNGRLLEQWADPSILTKLKDCFTNYDEQTLKRALQHQMDVYHDIASEVAARQGIPYPDDARKTIKNWIQKLSS
jgi:aminoglycoside 6-adenylyltransferase